MNEYGTFEDFYNTFKNWSKKDILRRTYDIAQESIQRENIIKEVRETLINSKEYKMAKEMNLTSKMSVLIELLEILDKEK